jgi:2-polyprenyl-6-methoxyphenol hydroxylase-like FAD-dependent oxidoreductase
MNGGRGQIHPDISTRSPDSKTLPPSFRAHRGRLEGLLGESLDIQWGHVLQDISSNGSEHYLSFKDKDKIQSTLLVDTSGVHSPIRKSLLSDSQLNILPYVVFRGTRHIDGTTFRNIYEPQFGAGNILEMKKGAALLQISINDLSTEGTDISYIYSRPAHLDDQLHRPGRELKEATDISEIFFAEVIKLPELKQPFEDAFDEKKMRGDRILHWLMRDILLPLDDLTRLSTTGILLIGDAAHALPILGGEGANAAILDAIELADCIANKGVDCVGGFYKARYFEWESEVRKGEERLATMHSLSRYSL